MEIAIHIFGEQTLLSKIAYVRKSSIQSMNDLCVCFNNNNQPLYLWKTSRCHSHEVEAVCAQNQDDVTNLTKAWTLGTEVHTLWRYELHMVDLWMFVCTLHKQHTLSIDIRELNFYFVIRRLTEILNKTSWCHNDISPENIMVSYNKQGLLTKLKLIDWEFAKRENSKLTKIPGKQYCVAPEYTTKLVVPVKASTNADLYSVGVVGFFTLVGRYPFRTPNLTLNTVQTRKYLEQYIDNPKCIMILQSLLSCISADRKMWNDKPN